MESSTTAHAGASSATETRTAPNPTPTSAYDRGVSVARLKTAADSMAARYGYTCMRVAFAQPGTDKRAKANQDADRQYRALMRLTNALAELAVGGAR